MVCCKGNIPVINLLLTKLYTYNNIKAKQSDTFLLFVLILRASFCCLNFMYGRLSFVNIASFISKYG